MANNKESEEKKEVENSKISIVENSKEEQKWRKILENWPQYCKGKKQKELKLYIRKGIPPSVRGQVWKQLAEVDALMRAHPNYYQTLLKQIPPETTREQIDKDVCRLSRKNISGAKNVCYAYAIHDPICGYCSGIGIITAFLLMVMTEEDAFWMLERLIKKDGKYQLNELFSGSYQLLHLQHFQFEKLLNQFIPTLANRLTEIGISPSFYCSTWFQTIFIYNTPFETSVRIWDIFLNEGNKFLFRIGLTLLKRYEKELLTSNFEQAVVYLRDAPKLIEVEVLITMALKWSIKHSHLNEAALHYKQKQQKEKQKQST